MRALTPRGKPRAVQLIEGAARDQLTLPEASQGCLSPHEGSIRLTCRLYLPMAAVQCSDEYA